MRKAFFTALVGALLALPSAFAHCPLCTVGAAVAAGGAAWLGINTIVIGLFIGAFAASMGWWISKAIKRKFIPFQTPLLVAFSFATTVWPMLPLLSDARPWYISIAGDYGSWLNRTYVLNLFVIGGLIGVALVSITPWLSAKITKLRHGKMLPFQGMGLTFLLLFAIGTILQFTV
ncbi:hypothetical protein J4453_03400 [Candidatus Woesearchaeota archaeon]|nr:hypothetical protein [Candidatus Woesearchaeota archaeon]